jgi:hypothetical protein
MCEMLRAKCHFVPASSDTVGVNSMECTSVRSAPKESTKEVLTDW